MIIDDYIKRTEFDLCVPSLWLGESLAFFDWYLPKHDIPLWRPHAVSYVVRDGDLSRPASDIRTRYVLPACAEIVDQMNDPLTRPVIPRFDPEDGVRSLVGLGKQARVEVAMGYDRKSAGTRFRIIAEKI